MSSSNKVSKKRRTVAASGINVSDGVKQYINESGWLTVIVAALLHCVSSVVMYTVESFDGGGFLCVFQPVATAALCVGLICSFVGARLRFSPIGITMVGLIIVCVSLAMLFVIGIISLFSEYSALGFIQQLLAVVTIIASFTAVLYLLFATFNRKVKSNIGLFPAIVGTIAVITLVVRTLITFASLKSELGTGWAWNVAETEMYSETAWVLRSVPAISSTATKMYFVRLVERICLVLMMASALPLFYSFNGFFAHFNRQLEFIREIPVQRRGRYNDDADSDDESRYDDIIGLGSRRNDRYRYDEIFDPNDGFDDDMVPQYGGADASRRRYDESQSRIVHREETPAWVEAAQVSSVVGQKIKVKPVKPSIPNPDEKDFWNQFTE